jgi:arylsulfatase A-like enzyme
MDSWLARVLEALDGQGVLDETLVLVLSDHGENFGEDGLIGHGLSLDERLIHIPFISAGPGSESIELTSLVDLPREIARACGIQDHPWRSSPPAGVATAQFDPPVLAGEDENIEKLRGIGIDGEHLEKFVTPLTCAVHNDLKLLRRGSEEVLFDLRADPGERHPLTVGALAADRADELEVLREALEFGARPLADPGHASPETAPSAAEMRELEERMKLLGYM